MIPFKSSITRIFSESPGWILIIGYLALILTGTSLLVLPQATVSRPLNFMDALFTASSAVCVTGLTVVSTAGTFTLFGLTVIMGLIQIGGVGIMVFSTLLLLSMGKRVSLTERSLIRDTYSYGETTSLIPLFKEIALFTILIEIIGALILFARFYRHQPPIVALYNSIFHSVSAFCNAGFSLFPDSFSIYRGDAIVNFTICILIILGGIGFVVLSEIKNEFSFSERRWQYFSLHTKLVLSSTLLLIVFSTGIFILLEWRNSIADLPFHQKMLTAFFQMVNARTAGFNSIEIGGLTNETLFFTILLMFIGTAPGSCGGGVKITTFSSLLILGFSRLKGQAYPQIFFRKISDTSVSKAVSVILISLLTIIIGIILLQQTEIGEVSHYLTRGAFLELMFEAVSAFGTVGLSTGVTPGLTVNGKLIICIMMFIGRLGPLVITMAISQNRPTKPFQYAQEDIMIG